MFGHQEQQLQYGLYPTRDNADYLSHFSRQGNAEGRAGSI